MHIHDYHEEEKNFQDILSLKNTSIPIELLFKKKEKSILYMLIKDRLFQVIVFPDRHNHQEINNLIQVENHHIQINEGDHNIGLKKFFKYKNYYSRIRLAYHEYHLNNKKK